MAGIKISNLADGGALQSNDQFPVARGNLTRKIFGSDLLNRFTSLNTNITSLSSEVSQQYVKKAGDTMTGFLTLNADPTANLHAATKQYADLSVKKAGDTMTGFLTLNANPTANLHAATKQYVDSANPFVTGMIIMWSGAIGSVPSGWALCNGSNGTPDLRNRFVVGAGSTYTVGATGGADTVTLTTAQMPVHGHTINDPGHNHTVGSRDDFGQHGGGTLSNNNSAPDQNTPTSTRTTGITINSAGGTNGVTQAHENRPPYYALAYIMKL